MVTLNESYNINFTIFFLKFCIQRYFDDFFFLFSGDLESLYAFSYQQNCDYPKDYGWDLFDTQTEYMRMGAPNENWVLSNFNKDYEVNDLVRMKFWLREIRSYSFRIFMTLA